MWLGMIVAAALTAGTAQDPVDPKTARVEEQIVGPARQGNHYVVSPRGAHLATVTQKGSRFVVIVDGVEGPKFDDVQILEGNAKVLFSPDGNRHAYVGRSGQEYVVMVDGKEHVRAGSAGNSYGSSPVSALSFTSNSKHVWFIQLVHKSNQIGDTYQCVVFDGVQGIPGGTPPVISPDGDHFAYVATNPRDTTQQTVILDGKPAGYSGADPRFTGDSKHLLVRTYVDLGPGRGRALQVLADGKVFLKADEATLFVAPAGDLVVAAVQRNATNAANGGMVQSFLVANGKKVEGSECSAVSSVVFSPDGKRYAAECKTPTYSTVVVVDGKRGQEYPTVTNLAFSEDSAHYSYQASMGGKFFLVIDGEESDGHMAIQEFAYGGRGSRVGYIALSETMERTVVVDGKATPYKSSQASGLAFSADGSRCGYLLSTGNYQDLVLDGVHETGFHLMPFRTTFDPRPTSFVFSPNGKSLAFVGMPAAPPDPSKFGLVVDRKLAQVGQTFWNPTFTPDGRHLFWMAPDAAPNRVGIFADGKPCAQLDVANGLVSNAKIWEMGDDGVLTVLGQDGDKMKRLRITPSSETNLETMVANAAAAGTEKPTR